MAYRVEIGEIVENATGLNITGATVTVRYHGGANAPVYDAENGGSLVTQPLTTVNGKIGADYPSGAWLAEGDYDLDVTFGGDTLTYFWPARRGTQFVTTLPAGAGTSAPEDGELAIELYDGTNQAAWLRRYRASVPAWDMIGGPPPAGGVLPAGPRARQEFYLTGSTPPVQHQRYNGASWDYVGTPPTVPVTNSPLNILDVGQANQRRAGRQLALADVNTLAALPTVPAGLFNLGDLTNLGSGGALSNRNSVTFGVGIEGVSNAAAQFDGTASSKCLFIDDTGAADPFRLKTGTWAAWSKTAKRGTAQQILSKDNTTTTASSYVLTVDSTNVAGVGVSGTGTGYAVILGTTDICDDRWHHVVGTFDGTMLRLYVDGLLESASTVAITNNILFQSSGPFNIGGRGGTNTGAVNPAVQHFGRVDEVLITTDILTEDQVRLLYAVKVPHGYSATPTRAVLSVRRKRRGANWVNADFPSQPVRYYDGGTLTDKGSGAVNLTANNTPLIVAGADGAPTGAYNFVTASSQSLSATDAGLPGTTTSRSYGCWFKTTGTGAMMGWGGLINSADTRIGVFSGALTANNGADGITGPFVADGQWHFAVVAEENAPLDGVKRKLYVDGRLAGTSLVLNSVTLTGASRFRVGCAPDASNFFGGQIGSPFVFAGILTQEQIAALYQKSSQALMGSPKEEGAHIEAFDATNVYWIADTLDSHWAVDLAVAS